MPRLIILIILNLCLNSCDQKVELDKYDKSGNLIVYSEEVYTEMWLKDKTLKVTVIDTFCINQKERAFQDIQKGKLIYFRPDLLEFQKLAIKLKTYGIETRKFYSSCLKTDGFDRYCYQDEMHKEISRRFGENFIDSLTEVAKREFVIENPNFQYIEDGIDLREKYIKEFRTK